MEAVGESKTVEAVGKSNIVEAVGRIDSAKAGRNDCTAQEHWSEAQVDHRGMKKLRWADGLVLVLDGGGLLDHLASLH